MKNQSTNMPKDTKNDKKGCCLLLKIVTLYCLKIYIYFQNKLLPMKNLNGLSTLACEFTKGNQQA